MSDIGEEPVHLLWLSQAPETLQGPRAFQGSGGGAVPSPGVGGRGRAQRSLDTGLGGLWLEAAPPLAASRPVLTALCKE